MKLAATVVMAGALIVPLTTGAHHSSVPWYDLMADQVTVTGVVTDFQFINPHVYIFVNVTNEDGTVEEWRIESTSKNRLLRSGWTEDSIKVGQTVTATGFPARNGNGIDCEKLVVEGGSLVWER
jgi:hypothetical protein